MASFPKAVALESRLRSCRNVLTLGVKPNFTDYDAGAVRRIRDAEVIYYPSSLYADLFDAMGKRTFPRCSAYRFAQDKIKQSALFQLLEIPHPRTRVFYGRRQQATIADHFSFPFVAKIPRGSAMGRGVFRIEDAEALRRYCALTPVAYIQEYLPSDRDVRVVVIGGRAVLAYWRIAPDGEFRANVSAGGRIRFDPVPDPAVALALTVAERCGWDDVGIDLLPFRDRWYVLEGNMKYGKEGFRQAGIDYARMMEQMIEEGLR